MATGWRGRGELETESEQSTWVESSVLQKQISPNMIYQVTLHALQIKVDKNVKVFLKRQSPEGNSQEKVMGA